MTLMLAECRKYPALYDSASGVRFRHGKAEVTEDQAEKLAERPYVDGIKIDGAPAKKWRQARLRAAPVGESP